jgi:prepilin-type N-terminal cleavage/methylation domain-containing protein
MTLRIGARISVNARGRRGFTLIELIVVMTLLVVVLGVSFPMLKGFFQGRGMDGESRRLLSLTQYGQSRAVAEGVPMILWIDPKSRRYGLEAQAGYEQEPDGKAVAYELDPGMVLRVQLRTPTLGGTWQPSVRGLGSLPMVRFLPDGSFGSSSPDAIILEDKSEEEVWIVRQTNQMRYAIESAPFAAGAR